MCRISAVSLLEAHIVLRAREHPAMIGNRLFERQGQAVTNFGSRLPALQSELALETLKDPYLFDFLGLGESAHERDIEDALVRHTRIAALQCGLVRLSSRRVIVTRMHKLDLDRIYRRRKQLRLVRLEGNGTPELTMESPQKAGATGEAGA